MMSNNRVTHDPIQLDAAGKLDTEKDEAKSSSPSDEKIKTADSDKKADADVVDDIECSEELQLSFPERLMTLLQGEEVTKAMRWLPSGEAFLLNPSIFCDVVLDGHFHGTKFESFTRKLNRWGFKRLSGKTIPKDCIAYHHSLFNKDHPELLDKMRSGKNRHVFVEELKPSKKQAALAAAASSITTASMMNQQFSGAGADLSSSDFNPLSHQARAGLLLHPQGHSSLGGFSASGGGGDLRRRLDEAINSQQNNNAFSTQASDHQLEAFRSGGDESFSPQMMMMSGGGGGGGFDSSMEFQHMMVLRQQQQQQQQQQQGMQFGDGGGFDPVMAGCNGDMSSSSSFNQQDIMRQLLVDQRAAARATEDSLRLHQLLSMHQGGGVGGGNHHVGGVGGGGAGNGGGGGSGSSSGNTNSSQDAKFYHLMRLRQQLNMVTRNS